jgi:hypothetical protein
MKANSRIAVTIFVHQPEGVPSKLLARQIDVAIEQQSGHGGGRKMALDGHEARSPKMLIRPCTDFWWYHGAFVAPALGLQALLFHESGATTSHIV